MSANSEANGKEASDLCLGYLTCPQDGAKAFLGALLLTDGRTRPLHFGYVSPVRPTTMQRILYGKTLDIHIKVDVIAHKLAHDGIGRMPDALFVDAPDLLEARRVFGTPTAHLSRTPAGGEPPGVRISTYVYSTGGSAEDEAAVGNIVAALEQEVDLLNPFDRVQEALKEALKEASK